jgi:long-subunit acyl-CoA synthetase (AMP-forming)
MQVLESKIPLETVMPNIATMLQRNVQLFGDKPAYNENHSGNYASISWNQLHKDILNIAFNLQHYGFKRGDKMIIYSPNRLEMLELELAVMATGGIAVPIFAYFHKETAELLIHHSEAQFAAVAGPMQLGRVDNIRVKTLFVFDKTDSPFYSNQADFSDLLAERTDLNFSLSIHDDPDSICLNMYTSGTMGIPKCVQLSHKNILSQQAALQKIWKLDHTDRCLSYLPWHHSFGGIFELFSALYNGAELSLESGYGKDPKVIMANWKLIQPTVFFSVPKVYQSLVELTKKDKEASELFFHSKLKFIFTAAASLPQKLSDEFERRKIPVIEGWGLTETSPCCTLTDPSIKRHAGIVGFPIPGVSIQLAEDGEILVKGPNVMKCYFKNDEANKGIFTNDGWFHTGDIGEITESGLKLITRKDRIFKLSNGEKVIPSDLEKLIELKCHYISFAMVVGHGEEYPVALLFPNKKLIDQPDYSISPDEGCFCPRNLNELGRCLRGCLHDANCGIGQKFAKIKAAMIIDDELSFDRGTLTSSMKLAPKNVLQAYKAHLENIYGAQNPIDNEVYIIKLVELDKTSDIKTKLNYA